MRNKKLVSMLLVSGMIFSSLAGCGQKETEDTNKNSEQQVETTSSQAEASSTQEDETKVVPDEIPLDYFAGTEISIAIKNNDADLNVDEYDQKLICKMLYEMTGIKVNWIPVASTGAGEKTATFLAGEMPDMMWGLVDDQTLLKNADLFYDLSEEGLLETYAPNSYAIMNGYGDQAWNKVTLLDGSVRALMSGEGNVTAGGSFYFINKVWLDKLGLEVPTTTDELYEVLCAFRDNDMNGNGDTTDEIPMAFSENNWVNKICNMANFFGLAGDNTNDMELALMVEDGKVVSTFDTQQYRDYLEYAHKLYSEGLLDVEGFSQTAEQDANKMAAGLVGVMGGWTPGHNVDAEMAEDYVPMYPLQAYEDVEYVKTGYKNQFDGYQRLVISAETENVEACLWLWDQLVSSPEVWAASIWGEPGYVYEIVDGRVKKYDSADRTYPEGYDASNYQASCCIFNVGLVPFVNGKEFYYQGTYVEGSRDDYVNRAYDYFMDDVMPERLAVPEEWTEENADVTTELGAYIAEFIGQSVTEGITDAQWNEHLEMLEELDYERYIELQQIYYDGSF